MKGLTVGFMVMSFLYFDTEVHRRTGPYMGGVGWCGGWWGGLVPLFLYVPMFWLVNLKMKKKSGFRIYLPHSLALV